MAHLLNGGDRLNGLRGLNGLNGGVDARWDAAGVIGAAPGLIPFLTSLLGLYGTYKGIEAIAAPPPPPPPPFLLPPGRVPAQLPMLPAPAMRGLAAATAWLVRIARRYGVVIANAVYDLYQQYKIQGLSDAQAKHLAKSQHGVRTGRRINPTNVRALRRAIRRVRSFQRITGKVERLLPRRRGGVRVRHVPTRYRHRRGDADFYSEDQADYMDEAEDFGYDPFCSEE